MKQDVPYFKVLDSWRGICACMVALVHFATYSHFYPYPIFWNAGYYVDFFFVLSGFVIFANYQDAFQKGFSVKKFMILRFARLYPLHFLTLAAFIGHELLQMLLLPLVGMDSISTYKPFTAPLEGPYEIAMNALLLQSFDVVGGYSLNKPSWSISAEFYTYILFAVLLVKFPKHVLYWLSLILLMGFCFFYFFDGKGATHNWGVLRCVYGFAAGGLGFILWKKYAQTLQHSKNLSKAIWSLLEFSSIALSFYLINAAGQTWLIYVTPFVFLFLIYVFAFEKGIISSVLKHKFFLLIGVLSYSIYMWHAFIAWKILSPVVEVFKHVSDLTITTITPDGKERIGTELWHGDIISILYLILIVSVSYISYRFFEEPCRNYIKKITLKK
jgi:peptidoglycan/LPS O-acetylase OafA/YrhL